MMTTINELKARARAYKAQQKTEQLVKQADERHHQLELQEMARQMVIERLVNGKKGDGNGLDRAEIEPAVEINEVLEYYDRNRPYNYRIALTLKFSGHMPIEAALLVPYGLTRATEFVDEDTYKKWVVNGLNGYRHEHRYLACALLHAEELYSATRGRALQ